MPPATSSLLARHPQGLRLQARAARHAEVDRQQPRHPRGHVARPRSTPPFAATPTPRLLYDQPYEDPSRIRVTGPFTVESLSPHRMLGASERRHGIGAGRRSHAGRDAADFVTIILDNLRKAGVQNTFKNERLELRAPRALRRHLRPGRRRVHRRRRQDPPRRHLHRPRVRHRRRRVGQGGRQGGAQGRGLRHAGRLRLRLRSLRQRRDQAVAQPHHPASRA